VSLKSRTENSIHKKQAGESSTSLLLQPTLAIKKGLRNIMKIFNDSDDDAEEIDLTLDRQDDNDIDTPMVDISDSDSDSASVIDLTVMGDNNELHEVNSDDDTRSVINLTNNDLGAANDNNDSIIDLTTTDSDDDNMIDLTTMDIDRQLFIDLTQDDDVNDEAYRALSTDELQQQAQQIRILYGPRDPRAGMII
jgi:hypothetical protein